MLYRIGLYSPMLGDRMIAKEHIEASEAAIAIISWATRNGAEIERAAKSPEGIRIDMQELAETIIRLGGQS